MQPSTFRFTLTAAVLVIVAAALAASLALLRSKPSAQTPAALAPTSTGSSAPIAGLDSKWLTVRQNALDDTNGRLLPGARATRETFVQEQGAHTELMLTELRVTDAGELESFLGGSAVRKTSIADRAGYLVPMASLAENTAFLLVGSETALLMEYGDDRYGNLMPWPETLDAAVAAFIQNARVD